MGSKCRFSKKNVGARVFGYKQIPSGDVHALEAAVATVGPISIAIDASQLSAYYSGGVNEFLAECVSNKLKDDFLKPEYVLNPIFLCSV